MLTATVACPGCAGSMALSGWTAGRQVRCPRCKAVFRLGDRPGQTELVGGNAAPSPAAPARPAPVPATRPVVATPQATPQPGPPQSAPTHAPPASRRAALLAVVLGGLLLFVGGTIGLAYLVAGLDQAPKEPPTPPPVAQNTKDGPPARPTPPNPAPVDPNPPPVEPPPVEPVVQPPMPMPPAGPGRRLPPELAAKVDDAVKKGTDFLLKHLRDDGTLKTNPTGFQYGPLFLVGLTLLECGVPADDPRLMRVSDRVRAYARSPNAVKNYEVSLALLYLDRLGDPKDKPLLQKLGVQLLASQQLGGGWSYDCAPLAPDAERHLLALLQRTRPERASDLIVRDANGGLIDLYGRPVAEDRLTEAGIKTIDQAVTKLKEAQKELDRFPHLRGVPSLRASEQPGEFVPPDVRPVRVRVPRMPAFPAGDNSNTQFAALGLWAASRHGVPCERALALLAARFRTTQLGGGGWGYVPNNPETPSMTCAGLLALAIGHGVRLADGAERREDDQIQGGLTALTRYLDGRPLREHGLYFLWSVERVGMLFNLDSIGNVEWYRWGAERLVPEQKEDGSWNAGGYHGSAPITDTSFALLFLKKANFVADLSNKLEQVLDIKGSRRQGNQP